MTWLDHWSQVDRSSPQKPKETGQASTGDFSSPPISLDGEEISQHKKSILYGQPDNAM